jgi:acyl transferase domain-containing protein/NADPH:quinone reductase-like Zn-dependent oxidoreductase/phospholipid N-methyltransferase
MTSAISLSALKFISPDSRCHSFDASGNGYAKGEGIGVLVLKRVEDALADGDTIRAVVRATATNQDGRTPGISHPSQAAQEQLIRTAYESAGLGLQDTHFFEAHGAGTTLGDPMEAAAVREVFGSYRSPDDPIYMGAVKANIGHLEAAAGIAGVIKTILSLEKGIIPPIAGLKQLNPEIRAEEWHLKFPTAPQPWPPGLRRASVNAFGYGGSNAHAVLDDAYHYLRHRGLSGQHFTAVEATNGVNSNGVALTRPPRLFVFSAADSGSIARLGEVYQEYLSTRSGSVDDLFLRNLAFTLSAHRSCLPWKSYALASSVEDLARQVTSLSKPVRSSVPPRLQFIFTGQGAQWATMGLALNVFAVFRHSIQAADACLQRLGSGWSLLDELAKPAAESQINTPALAQPLSTALQIALVELFASWGVTPSGVAGHSSGEIAAAYSAGAISREAAWIIAYHRGVLAARLATAPEYQRGAMMAVALSEDGLRPYLQTIAASHGSDALSIGCFNSAQNLTVTGRANAIDELQALLDDDGVFARKLAIPVAYHSAHMQVIADEYERLLRPCMAIASSPSHTSSDRTLFISSVSGDTVKLEELKQPEYWVRNLVSPVQFSSAVSKLAASNSGGIPDIYIEVGPHAALQRAIQEGVGSVQFKYASAMRRNELEGSRILHVAGMLWTEGYPIDIQAVHAEEGRGKMLADLPQYPFNHSQTYWLESRLFRNYRRRNNIRHELVGIPAVDWNPLEPHFRFTIREADLPWTTDHKMNGSAVYPGAGMIVMALEAARYLARPGARGYRIRNLVIFTAVVIPSTPDGVETQVHLRLPDNRRTTGVKSVDNWEFHTSALAGDDWVDVCAGSITIEYEESASDEIYAGDEHRQSVEEHRARFEDARRRCTTATTRELFYEVGAQSGYGFGPLFNTLHGITYDAQGVQAMAELRPDEWQSKLPAQTQPHLIHPTTLDGVFQVTSAATTKGGTVPGPLQAPTQVRDFWIAESLLQRTPETRLQVMAQTTRQAVRETDSFILVLNSDTGEPALVIDGYRVTTVSSLAYSPSAPRNIFYRLRWAPDLEQLDRAQVEAYCLEQAPMPGAWTPDKEAVTLSHLAQMLRQLDAQGFVPRTPHGQKYIAWVRRHLDMREEPIFEDRDQYLSEFAATGPVEAAVQAFGAQLAAIVREEADPLDLLFNQNIARDLYTDPIFVVTGKRMAAWIDLLAHKQSNLNILEIGAGTGSGTQQFLDALGPRYAQYTFTDISPSFFDKAKTRFPEHLDRMVFKTLDIECSPADQGFPLGQYDLVVAATVLHATACVEETLRHARALCKPGGYLVLMEPTNKHDTVLNSIWGTLPGWWRSREKSRQHCPLYSLAEWDHALQRADFSGIEAAVPDHPEPAQHTFSFLLSRAVGGDGSDVQRPLRSLMVVVNTERQHAVAQELLTALPGTQGEIVSLGGQQQRAAEACVSLLDLDPPFLANMTENEFAAFKELVGCSSHLYWITSGGGQTPTVPETALSSGFSRTITLERPELHMVSVDIPVGRTAAASAATIARFLQQDHSTSLDDREGDYLVAGGKDQILIPRVVEAADVNDYVHTRTGQLPIETRAVDRQPDVALEIQFSPGQLDSFRFVRDPSAGGILEPDELEVEVKASGVNFADVMCALGQISDTYIGHEFAGVVRRVGGAAAQTFAPGDRVTGIASGTFRTFVRSRVHTTILLPGDTAFTDAFPAIWLTALYGITHLGRLRAGESVLIHAAAGAVGQAAIQLAQLLGADVFVTVGSPAKKQLLQDLYGIPNDRFFSSRRLGFGPQIRRATGGRGVDVILNSTSGEALVETWRCIAPLGRFVEIGKRDIYSFQSLPMYEFSKNVTFSSLDLQAVYHHHPSVMAQLMQELHVLLQDRKLAAPQPVTRFTRGELESAFRFLQSGKHMGKAVIDWDTPAEIRIVPTVEAEYSFVADASYVIVGGLGGIGRSLARWFARRGARHLILLSRSGATGRGDASSLLLKDLAQSGVQVATPRCDVCDAESLAAALQECSLTMPPVKGVIQASMVLKVNHILSSFVLCLLTRESSGPTV